MGPRLLHGFGVDEEPEALESAFTELGLSPEHSRLIACFSPLQTKARSAAEQVDATTLPYSWIRSEQGSADSHKDHRFRHFLDHSHPLLR